MAATLLLLPSCTDELSASKDSNDGNATADTRTMTITATMTDDGDNDGNGTTGSNTGNGNDGQAQTRVSHESDKQGDTPGVIVKWTKGDAFKLYPATDNATEFEIAKFEIKNDGDIKDDGKTANFTGATDATGEANALYPATAALTLKGVTATKWADIVLKMEGQKQNGNDSYAHLSAYDYMTASTNDAASLNSGNGNGNDLAFHHLAAMMTIKITGAPTDYTATNGTTDNSPELLTLTAGQAPDGSGTYGTFYRGINADGDPNKTGNSYKSPTSSINLALEGITWNADGFTAHMMMLPTDLTGKTFTVSVRCKDGTTYQYTTTQIGKKYVAGMRYTAKIDGGENWTKMTGEDKAVVFNNDTEAATEFASGKGKETDPYIISTARELKYLVEQANSKIQYGSGKYFRLTTDIKVEDDTDWTPIAAKTEKTKFDFGFSGHFDGGGHTIYGTLKDSRDEDKKGYIDSYFGFFGRIFYGSVRNLNIKATVTNTHKGSSEVCTGGLAGNIYMAEISGCNIDGKIQGGTTAGTSYASHTGGLIGSVNAGYNDNFSSTISNCTVSGKVTAGEMTTSTGHVNNTGGVAGYISCNTSNPITIKNCTNHADITGSSGGNKADSDTGGIAGLTSHANISQCTNDGKISVQYTASGGNCLVGGLIGMMEAETNLSDSENQGAVTGGQVNDADYVSCCGGLIGHTQSSATATNCTNSGTVSGNAENTNIINHTGGLVGRNNGTLHQCLNTDKGAVTQGASNANNHTGGLVGHNNPGGKVYDCCTNLAKVNDEEPTDKNRISGDNEESKKVIHCEEGHISSTTTTDKHISSDGNENYEEEIL